MLDAGASGLLDSATNPRRASANGNDIVGKVGPAGRRCSASAVSSYDRRGDDHTIACDDTTTRTITTRALSPASMPSGLVALKVTLTDGDVDTATDSIELGSLFKFEDDGPVRPGR